MRHSSFAVLTLYLFLSPSCSPEIPFYNLNEDPLGDEIIGFSLLSVESFSNNSISQQSSAVYNDYCIMIADKRKQVGLYNLKTKKLLCSMSFEPAEGYDYQGYVLYHCNQASFGTDFFDNDDPFPLLYISQRARTDHRCFVEVFRVLPTKSDEESDYSAFTMTLVQTIFFPVMSAHNCMGNVNCVIDQEEQLFYTYSRNNNINDSNYGNCKISCFEIPHFEIGDVELNDNDILNSFDLDCSAIYMQGGCIYNGYLYIAQGYESAGFIYLNIIDLDEEKIEIRIDLLHLGYRWEPEGCFMYDGRLMVTAGTTIWEFKFVN